jgi:hypothetical protein
MTTTAPSLGQSLGRGILSGLAGTVVMTAFQQLVEMPLTKRPASSAPADLAEKVLPVHPRGERERTQLNWGTHLALGAVWGAAYGVAAHAGLRGQRAVGTVFAVVYTGDVALNTALGLYQPSTWSARDWAIDVAGTLVQAEATGVIYDRVLDPSAP